MKYAMRFHFYSTFENYLWHINTLILYNGIEWNVVIVGIYFTCLQAGFHFICTLFLTHLNNEIRVEIPFLFDISKLLVAYKHTYFVQRNRMKGGHSRNLFYVSTSCFSFYLHTFVTHLNKWNTRWDFIFTAAAGRPPALAALPGQLRAAFDQDNAVYRREPLQRTANGEPVPRHD